jgi:uncharacterized protein YbgA (DUF1722 family)
MQALVVPATRGRHASVLRRAAGALRGGLDAGDRAELSEAIDDYRSGRLPLVAALALLRHHARRLGVASLLAQSYLQPHPKELLLRNHA